MFLRFTKLLQKSNNIRILRNINNTSNKFGTKTYEGEGKTNLQILNNESDLGIMINGFSQVGFRLNNDMTVLGPILIFPKTILSWNVKDVNDITEESLSLFTILEPKIDILVIGIGDATKDTSLYTRLFPIGKKLNIALEVLSTERACSTFNFLNTESRCVAGAFIPPDNISINDDDLLLSKLRYQRLYETDDVQPL